MGYSFGSRFAGKGKDWQDIKYSLLSPKTIRLTLFWLSNCFARRDVPLLGKAQQLAGERGFRFDIVPDEANRSRHIIKWDDPVQEDDYARIRLKCAEIYDDQKAGGGMRFPVIFGSHMHGGGITTQAGGWPKYCFISPASDSHNDNVTLLHEIGHGADLEHHDYDHLEPNANFMCYKLNRNCMQKYQVLSLAEAYFVS